MDEHLCDIGYSFAYNICKSDCLDFDCDNNGKCTIDKYGCPMCQCQQIGDFVFTGLHCEIRTEKLALESKFIIAITATVGIILVIFIMITCFLYYLKGRKVRSMTKTIESVGDREDLSQYLPSSIRRSFYTSADTYASVYKSQDNECTHHEAIDNSKDRGNKINTNTDYMITEVEVRPSPWYQSTEIINGKEIVCSSKICDHRKPFSGKEPRHPSDVNFD
ncbi:unnamed protein product [Mytilus coruscus]|uniref:EGF-like domain-containing protein n=1 Tax=Mytilus coruscus TaxID=42192 RepID=A0A6J8AKR4_MYTCO|nr:unnamed protein product [Mytilus coruscus]